MVSWSSGIYCLPWKLLILFLQITSEVCIVLFLFMCYGSRNEWFFVGFFNNQMFVFIGIKHKMIFNGYWQKRRTNIQSGTLECIEQKEVKNREPTSLPRLYKMISYVNIRQFIPWSVLSNISIHWVQLCVCFLLFVLLVCKILTYSNLKELCLPLLFTFS